MDLGKTITLRNEVKTEEKSTTLHENGLCIEISKDTIQTWITQCKQLMEKAT